MSTTPILKCFIPHWLILILDTTSMNCWRHARYSHSTLNWCFWEASQSIIFIYLFSINTNKKHVLTIHYQLFIRFISHYLGKDSVAMSCLTKDIHHALQLCGYLLVRIASQKLSNHSTLSWSDIVFLCGIFVSAMLSIIVPMRG